MAISPSEVGEAVDAMLEPIVADLSWVSDSLRTGGADMLRYLFRIRRQVPCQRVKSALTRLASDLTPFGVEKELDGTIRRHFRNPRRCSIRNISEIMLFQVHDAMELHQQVVDEATQDRFLKQLEFLRRISGSEPLQVHGSEADGFTFLFKRGA